MFLVDAAEAEADWDSVESNVRDILGRVEAEVVSLKKWDTRRLAYEINKKSRGTYILCHFRVDGTRVGEIERTVQLSERIMRVLILSVDHLTQDDVEEDTSAVLAEKQREEGPEAVAEQVSAVEDSGTDDEVPEPAVGAAEETAVELVSTEVSEDVAGVSEKTAEKSEEPKPAPKVRKSWRRRRKTSEASAEAGEPEQQAETKDDSGSADKQDTEKSSETEQ
jgi:small subunit ribosomal protein S6